MPYFQHWGDDPRPRFCSDEQIQVKTKKKGSHQKWNIFSANSSGDLRSDAHQSQIIGGDADVDRTQIIGGIQSNYWGEYIPIPPGFRHPCPYNTFGGLESYYRAAGIWKPSNFWMTLMIFYQSNDFFIKVIIISRI